MRHNLTKQQWKELFTTQEHNTFQNRSRLMRNIIGDLPVIYDEFDPDGDLVIGKNDEIDPGYWGFLIGDEKHINWILLQL